MPYIAMFENKSNIHVICFTGVSNLKKKQFTYIMVYSYIPYRICIFFSRTARKRLE